MSPAANLFRIGAFVALVLMIRHTQRKEGTRAGALLVAYLTSLACLRECVVWLVSRANHDHLPYEPQTAMGQIGPVNVVVVAGWVFTILVSYALARMIQRKNLLGTNMFLTLALTALVSTAIGYAVEITGIRIQLWRWIRPTPTTWLPFDVPSDMFDAWATTSFIIMMTYCALRYRLFATTVLRSVVVTASVLAVFGFAVFALRWSTSEPPHQKLMVVYVALSVILGFTAPRSLLGSSGRALSDSD